MKAAWKTVLQTPLNQMLDTRSRPPDLTSGAFRYKQNWAINSSGKLCRQAGFARLSSGSSSSNWDHYHRNGTRYPITRLYESASPDGVRELLDATSNSVSLLNNTTGEWADLLTGMGGGQWSFASLRDKIILTNNVDPVKIFTLGEASAESVASLLVENVTEPVRAAKVAIEFAGVVVLMNLLVDKELDNPGAGTERFSSRVQWSDFNNAEHWDDEPFEEGGAESVANYQDLDYGEEILNAVQMAGVVWIFTDRSIWKMFPQTSTTDTSPFGFQKWYTDPKNRNACLAFDNAVVSTGSEIFWLGRSTIYWINRYSTAPASPDWLQRGSGLMYEGADRIDALYCQSPVADCVPDAEGMSKEVWFSYPTVSNSADELGINSRTLVLSFNTDSVQSAYQTASYMDHGFTAFGRFSQNSDQPGLCKGEPKFLAASATDYCIKQIGGVFYREMVTLTGGDPSLDITTAVAVQVGYMSLLRGLVPFGANPREKTLRSLQLEHDTRDASALFVHLRIGNSPTIQDPNTTDNNCRVLWREIDSLPLACGYSLSPAQLQAAGLRADEADATDWDMLERGVNLYYELKIATVDGSAGEGGDTAWASLNWDGLF